MSTLELCGREQLFLELKKNERILVAGASGGVGSAAVMIASRLGAYVIGTSGNGGERDTSKVWEQMNALAQRKVSNRWIQRRWYWPVDMVIENVGAPTFDDNLRSLKPGGRLVLIGNVPTAA